MWLQAPRVVAVSLRDVGRGRAVSVPSRRYRAIYTISRFAPSRLMARLAARGRCAPGAASRAISLERSEEHTSELQSRGHLVCRLPLAKKKHHHTPHAPPPHTPPP